jgi:alpha-N-acetylglucosamine transferase
MNGVFVTLLGTDSFLAGVLALQQSFKTHNRNRELVVLYTENVSGESLNLLERKKISLKRIKEIKNPHSLGEDERGFGHTFTKLRIFELVEYDKLVYIDSDMLLCANIEALLDKPHMSAVKAGSLMTENFSWKNLNSGLMIIQPSLELAERIYDAIQVLPSADGSDQGFLQSFYPDWPITQDLHVDHSYNVPIAYLESYCKNCGLSFSYVRRKLQTNIAVLHYWGKTKPWHFNVRTFSRRDLSKQAQAIIFWWDVFAQAIKGL